MRLQTMCPLRLNVLPFVVMGAAPCMAQIVVDPPIVLPSGDGPTSVDVGDVDLDGDLDILVPSWLSHDLTIHENLGGGEFAPGVSLPLPGGGAPAKAVVGDVNGDCLPDVVVAGGQSSSVIYVLIGDGTGAFAPAVQYTIGGWTRDLALVDVDQDGDLDALAPVQTLDQIGLMLNDGNGVFTLGTPLPAGDQPTRIGVGDFDGNGHADVCATNWRKFTQNFTVHLADGFGGFLAPGFYDIHGDFPNSLAVADWTGDGILDVAIISDLYGDLEIRRGTGTGTFPLLSSIFGPTGWVQSGDVDGDGRVDLIQTGSEVNVYRAPDGVFLPPVNLPGSLAYTVGDVNGDGAVDFLANLFGADAIQFQLNRTIHWQQSPVNGDWYHESRPLGWNAAEERATQLGGHLATVRSAAENAWLRSSFAGDFFIGYSDAQSQGQWSWASGEPVGYENWAPGQPSGAPGFDFARVDAAGQWYDTPESAVLPGIAEVISDDCDMNGRPDAFEIAAGWAEDVNGDGVLDSCLSPYYCPAPANSSGSPARITFDGTPAIGVDTVHFEVTDVPPNRFGYFLMADSQGFVPMVGGGQGNLCLGLPFVRFAADILNSGAGGTMSFTPDLVTPPQGMIQQGSTWNFQCWFRDANPGPTSNLSDAVQLTFSADPRPLATFAPPCTGLEEQTTQFDVPIELSWAWHQDVVLPYVVSGTATNLVDWRVESPNPIVIPAGQTGGVITITVAEDTTVEPLETGVVQLLASPSVRPGVTGTYELRIRDDD